MLVRIVPGLSTMLDELLVERYAITTTVLVVALVIAHKWLPAGQRSFRQIMPGIVFTLALSFAFAVAFANYLAEFARNYVSTYAGLASVMIALVFLYALASIFVYGGELNAAISRAQARKDVVQQGPKQG